LKLNLLLSSLILIAIFLVGCTSVRVINTPPDLSNCFQLGWVESKKIEILSARQEMEKDVKLLAGNLLYALPLQLIENSEGVIHKGIAYKCVN
jgi:hypothetical protein